MAPDKAPSTEVLHTPCMARALMAIILALAVIAVIWASSRRFELDLRIYGAAAALSLFIGLLGVVYIRFRVDRNLSALLFGGAFLVAFGSLASVLNYFLLTVAGARIDNELALFDRLIGVDWLRWMAWCADHPEINHLLWLAYNVTMLQMVGVLIGLAFTSQGEVIYQACLAFAIGASLTIGVWAIAPSFGAFSVYTLPPDVAARLSLALDESYARELVRLLEQGPGYISPSQSKGLVGFPSFHAGIALIAAWYGRRIPYLGLPLMLISTLTLLATPIQGGHHVVDVIAAFPVTAIAIFASSVVSARCKRALTLQRRLVATNKVRDDVAHGDRLSGSTSRLT